MTGMPSILFACVHNSGRSVASAALARRYAGDTVEVRSADSEPGTDVNPGGVQMPAVAALPVADRTATKLHHDLVDTGGVVITLGSGKSCPVAAGDRTEAWQVDDRKGQDTATVRRIVAALDAGVPTLLGELAPQLGLAPSVLTTAPSGT